MSHLLLNALFEKTGGRYPLAVLTQQRMTAIMRGAPPLVPNEGLDPYQTVLREIQEDKIFLALAVKKKEHTAQ